MKKLLGVFAAVGCMLACCFALAGCSGGDTSESQDFIGEWVLESVTAESSDMKVTPSDVALMKSFGYTATLTLNADGTASLDMFGEVTECTWSGKDSTSAVLTVEEEKVDLAIDEDGALVMSQNGDESITFVRADQQSESADSQDAAVDAPDSNSDAAVQDGFSDQQESASATSSDSSSSSDTSGSSDASGSASTDSSDASESDSQSSTGDFGEESSSTTDSAE